jgi:AraC-like DNA-binding protein
VLQPHGYHQPTIVYPFATTCATLLCAALPLPKIYFMEDFRKRFLLSLLGYAVQKGISPQRLCELSGVDYRSLQRDTRTAIGPEAVNSLWKNAAHLSGDPLFGLHFGESMQLAALGAIGQIVQTSNTAGEALSNAGALLHLITDMFSMKITLGKKYLEIYLLHREDLAAAYPYTYRHMADYLMAFVLHELDGLLLRKTEPAGIQFAYPIADTYEYARIFRCSIKQKAGAFLLTLPRSFADEPVLSANYEMQQHLLQKVNLFVKNSGEEGLLHTRIYNYLLTNSYLYTLSQESVAANFNISPRSLQRRLKEEGITYLQIVEEVRKTLALHYLGHNHYQVKDIAFILGYNEQSAFVRAFKRWTGVPPSQYLQQQNRPQIVL